MTIANNFEHALRDVQQGQASVGSDYVVPWLRVASPTDTAQLDQILVAGLSTGGKIGDIASATTQRDVLITLRRAVRDRATFSRNRALVQVLSRKQAHADSTGAVGSMVEYIRQLEQQTARSEE